MADEKQITLEERWKLDSDLIEIEEPDKED